MSLGIERAFFRPLLWRLLRCLPAVVALPACLPPNIPQFDDRYAGTPESASTYWGGARVEAGREGSPAVSRRPLGDSLIDARKTYDLPALVDLALHAHPETRASWEEAQAAAARLEKDRAAWYPRLTAMAFAQHFQDTLIIKTGPLRRNGYEGFGGLDLAWTLFDFGRRTAAVEGGAHRLTAANFAFNRKHQEIAYRVAVAFFVYQSALARIGAAQATLTAAAEGAAAVQAKFDKGLATRPDLLLAIQEQAKASYDLQDARGALIQARADLAASLGISPAHTLNLVDLSSVPLPESLAQSAEKIADQALEQRPDLIARLAELRAREAEIKKAWADFWPKVSMRAMVGDQYWGGVRPTPPGDQSYSLSHLVDVAGLTLEWTLFDGFERTSAIREAVSRREAAQAQLESLRLEIVRDIWKAYADTKTSLQKRDFANALLKAAEDAYAATRESYGHGLTTVIELLSAQKDLARARYTEIDSRAALLRSAATLVYAAGEMNRGEASGTTPPSPFTTGLESR